MNVSLITYLHNIIPFTHHNIPYGNVKKLVILAMSSFNIFFIKTGMSSLYFFPFSNNVLEITNTDNGIKFVVHSKTSTI